MSDVFICHAGEDKAGYVEPLVAALELRGVDVWYDRLALQAGDDLAARIDAGLRSSRFAVVVLTPRLFVHRPDLGAVVPRYWPRVELGALVNQEAVDDRTRIIPLRCDLTHAELTARLPIFAGRHVLAWSDGLERVADDIARAVLGGPVRFAPPTGGGVTASPIYNLPRRRAHTLFGRADDLAHLDELLAPGDRVRLSGLAGIGKTELARHAVDRLARAGRFAGGIYWFDASSPDLTPVWGGPIADALGIEGVTMVERAASARRHVASRRPVLLVLDNVEAWTRATMPGPLPDGPGVTLLVTTRHARLGGNDFTHVAVGGLAPGAAGELLRATARRSLDEVDELLDHLGGHALAVELAGAYLGNYSAETPRGYLGRLRAGQPVEEAVRDEVTYERTVAQALDTIWQVLAPRVQHAARIAACFAGVEATTSLLAPCGIDEESVRMLERFHLLTVAGERWRMHRLVGAHAARRGNDQEQGAARTAFIEGALALARAVDDVAAHRLYATEHPHFERALAVAATVWDPQDLRWTELLCRACAAATIAGDYHRARELGERALTDAAFLGEEHPRLAEVRSNLAGACMELGELHRARELNERAIASYQGLGGRERELARCWNNLGLVLEALGDFEPSCAALERALAIYAAQLGDDHPALAIIRGNLGQVVHSLGDLPRARALLERALAVFQAGPGPHPLASNARSNLALVLRDQGELASARALLEQALATHLANHGEKHPMVAMLRNNLGVVCKRLGDFAAARVLLEQAVTSRVALLGDAHAQVASLRANLAPVLVELGELPRARELLDLVLASIAARLGEHHATTIGVRRDLAFLETSLGNPTRARDLLDVALADADRSLAADNPNVDAIRRDLAILSRDLGELARAKELLERLLATTRDEDQHLALRFNLATVYELDGELERARELYTECLAAEEAQLGPTHPTAAFTRAHLGRTLLFLGDGELGHGEILRALEAVEALPDDHEDRIAVQRIAGELVELVESDDLLDRDGDVGALALAGFGDLEEGGAFLGGDLVGEGGLGGAGLGGEAAVAAVLVEEPEGDAGFLAGRGDGELELDRLAGGDVELGVAGGVAAGLGREAGAAGVDDGVGHGVAERAGGLAAAAAAARLLDHAATDDGERERDAGQDLRELVHAQLETEPGPM